ncbi:phosphatase PAP2 family protein [Vagococcus sp.]|uniref:phosphatase PAP2 family protein n=1 Tax=Vagococcus sp. TaxID=1933889 RepID=UPI003F984557
MKNKIYWQFAASVTLLLFAMIAYFVISNPIVLQSIDQPIIHFIRGSITPTKTSFFQYITKFSNTITIIFLTLVGSLSLYYWKEKISAYWLLINSALVQGLGNIILKSIFSRPRPAVSGHLVHATGFSFPSGHAMGSMLFYGTLILVLPNLIKNKKIRLSIQLILGLLILFIGMSRVYLGVHYPTDVLGGWLIGVTWLLATYPIFKKLEFKQEFGGNK